MRSLYPTDIVVVDRTKEKRTRETERERGKRMQYVLLFYQRTPVEAKSDRGKKREREKKTLCVYIYISARYTLLSLYLHILDYYWYCCQSRWQQSMSRLKAFIQC